MTPSCKQYIQLGAVGGGRGSVERKSQQLDMCSMHHACALMCCLSERKNAVCDVFDSLIFVKIVRYPINTIHSLSLQA